MSAERIKNFSWIFGSLGLPVIAAAIAIPHLLEHLGEERFGLLALAWGLISYSGVFDLGIGKAVTQLIAKINSSSSSGAGELQRVVRTAIVLTSASGMIGCVVFIIAGILGVGDLIRVSGVDSNEIFISICVLSLGLPIQAVGATYRGVSEAYLRFRGISVVRGLTGVASFILPLATLIFSSKIYFLILSIILSRSVALFFYKYLASLCIGPARLDSGKIFSKPVARDLFGFAGWYTVSIVIVPIIGLADRFIISTMISASAVSLYVVPYELVAQSLIVVGAISTLKFPYLTQLRAREPLHFISYAKKVLLAASFLMLFIALVLGSLGDVVLRLWLGSNFNEEMHKIFLILCLGIVPYAVGAICTTILQSAGRTDVAAKINIIELPGFALLTYLLIYNYGIDGAAYAWVIRTYFDAAVFLFFTLNE
jgi:O-antigen/teichoic acid export membrane protein